MDATLKADPDLERVGAGVGLVGLLIAVVFVAVMAVVVTRMLPGSDPSTVDEGPRSTTVRTP